MKHAVKIIFIFFFAMLFSANVLADWTAETPMNIARDQFTGGVINGKIYVFGGNGDPNGINLKSTEMFDPVTHQWTYKADNEHNSGYGVEELTGAVVNDRLYVFGAYGGGAGVINFVEEYNPATNMWISKAPKPTVVTSGPALVYNSEIYVFGGSLAGPDPRSQTNVVEAYSPATNSWRTNITPMPIALTSAAVAVAGNKAYVFGGAYRENNLWIGSDAVMVLDFTANTWSVNGYAPLPFPQVFSYAGAVPVIDGKVYLTGGIVDTGTSFGITNMVKIYDIVTNTWSSGPSLPTTIDSHLSLALNNTIYVIGGSTDNDGDIRTSAVWKLAAADTFNYYCDSDSDTYISSSVSDTCTGNGCIPAGCLITAGDDCDDNDDSIHSGASDINCDGIDNNCNSQFDEGYVQTSTNCGVGECARTGQLICQNGSTVDTCVSGQPQIEGAIGNVTCSDSKDNDCDGDTDVIDLDCNNPSNGLPDLVLISVGVTPTTVIRGSSITVTDTIKNRGKGPAGESTTNYFLSKDNIKSKKDTLLNDSSSVDVLNPVDSSSGTTTVTITANTKPGKYYVIACADDTKHVTESKEKKNCRSSKKMIKVQKE